jgi:hypothetical protein
MPLTRQSRPKMTTWKPLTVNKLASITERTVGTIGARGNNGLQVSGVNWVIKIIPVKFLPGNGPSSISDEVAGITSCWDLKPKASTSARQATPLVASTSTPKGRRSRIGSGGHPQLCAAGNKGQDNDTTPHYPANFDLPSTVSVGASDKTICLPTFRTMAPLLLTSSQALGFCRSLAAVERRNGWHFDGHSCTAGLPPWSGRFTQHLGGSDEGALMGSSTKLASLKGKCVSGGRVNVAQALLNAGPIAAHHTNAYSPTFVYPDRNCLWRFRQNSALERRDSHALERP